MTNSNRPFFSSGEDSFKAGLCLIICVAMIVTMCCSGCAAGGNIDRTPPAADEAPAADAYPLVWWTHVTPAMWRASARWMAATGLEIRFEPGGAPVYYLPMDQIQTLCDEGAHGCIEHDGRIAMRADWIGTDNEEVTLIHEIGHMMLWPALPGDTAETAGAHHDIPGVMHEWWTARDTGAAITDELLEVVCSARPCTRFQPESARAAAP